MFTVELKKKTAPWVAAGFCAFLSLITVSTNIGLSFVNHTYDKSFMTGFLCFLPMCFFFTGAFASHLQSEIRELRGLIAKLQQRPNADPQRLPD